MLYNPYLEGPYEISVADAWSEGFAKGFLYNYTIEPSGELGAAELDAFNEGVQAGLDASTNGIALDEVCVIAGESHSEIAELLHELQFGGETLLAIYEAVKHSSLVAGVAGGFVAVTLLLISSVHNTLPPEQVLPTLGQPTIDRAAALGLDNVELFCGVGIDPLAEGCEFMLTPLFKSFDQARDAAGAMGRETIVVSWRTDQSGSFTVRKGY